MRKAKVLPPHFSAFHTPQGHLLTDVKFLGSGMRKKDSKPMQTIPVETHVGADGILQLALPLDIAGTDLEVLVVVPPQAKRSWPPGSFEQTAGSLADDPLARPSQGTYAERDTLL